VTSAALLWPPTRPRPSATSKWIDVSNWQGALSHEWFDLYGGMGFNGLIVQAVTGNDGRSYTRQQLQAAVWAHWDAAGYIWCNAAQALDLTGFQARLSLFDGFNLDFLALDVEAANTRRNDVDRALDACDAYVRQQTWMYTAYWVFERQGWLDVNWWADRPLWDGGPYDGDANIDVGFRPYGGWTQRTMKQYSEHPVDMNVRRA